jgi:hypothetical protein
MVVPPSAEYLTIEVRSDMLAIEVPCVSGWECPFDQAIRAGKYARGYNRVATVEHPTRKRPYGPRERAILDSLNGSPLPQTWKEIKMWERGIGRSPQYLGPDRLTRRRGTRLKAVMGHRY